MRFIDLEAQQGRIKEEILRRIHHVLGHGQYILGPEVQELEANLSAYVGVRHAVGCSSGTDALLMALMALGVGRGDAVLTTPFTFAATAEVIAMLGATPVFVDIDPRTFNLSADELPLALEAVQNGDRGVYPVPRGHGSAQRLTARGVVPVNLFGLPADYEGICAVARVHNLFVVEDAAQSFGAEYFGKKSGSLGDMACTSFYPSKPLGCYGDGGMCFTDDEDLAMVLRSLRDHGNDGGCRYESVRIGINGRLDTIQAAVLLAKLEIFPEELELRQQVASRYIDLMSSLGPGLSLLPPHVPSGHRSAWALYNILAQDEGHRSLLQGRLRELGIPCAVYYPKPLHLQPAFAYLGYRKGDFPVSEDVSTRILSLPMHPYLEVEEQERIVSALAVE